METTYETRTRTRTDRYGGYTSYSNRNMFDEDYNESTTMTNYEQETPEYEVQQNYMFESDSSIRQDEVTKTMAMPEVVKKERTFESVEPQSKVKIRARAKIAIAVYSIILLSLISFAIYNAVAINNMQAEVAAKNQLYITQSVVINDLLNTYNELGSEDRILNETQGEFFEPTENDIVRVSKSSMETRQEVEVESNWFEELCSFLSGLFS